MCLTKKLVSSGCGDKCLLYIMLERVVRELRQEDHEFWARLSYGDLWSCHKQKCSMSNNEHMLFLFSDPSGAIIMMNLGVIFYTEKLLKSSLFMDSWIFWDQRGFNGTRLKKKSISQSRVSYKCHHLSSKVFRF